MALNMDNLIINRPITGSMMNRATGEAYYSLDQIKEASLEITGEQAYVVDAVGAKIAAFDRNKETKLTGSNALVSFGMMAAQFGSDKKVASDTAKLIVPARETPVVTGGVANLQYAPATGEVVSVSIMTKDKGIAEPLEQADAAAKGKFAIADKKITVDTTTVPDGTMLIVLYKRESASAVQIENRADCFAKGGEFWLEVLFGDLCDPNAERHGFIVFPNAKMSNETTIDFNNETTHGFTIEAMQDYCDPDKRSFYIVITE